MTELHLLHMNPCYSLCSITLNGEAKIRLVEEGGGTTDIVHGRYGELLRQRVTFHLGGVSSQNHQCLSSSSKTTEFFQKLADILCLALPRRYLVLQAVVWVEDKDSDAFSSYQRFRFLQNSIYPIAFFGQEISAIELNPALKELPTLDEMLASRIDDFSQDKIE